MRALILAIGIVLSLAASTAHAGITHTVRFGGMWADVVARGAGFAWVYARPGQVVFDGIATVPVPQTDHLRFLDAEHVSGTVFAIGQGGEGSAWLVSEAGAIANLGPTHGNNPVALSSDAGGLLVYIMRAPDRVDVVRADGSLVSRIGGAWTSQGIRQVRAGEVIWGDATYSGTISGYGFGEYQQLDGMIAGQHGFSVGLLLRLAPPHFVTARQAFAAWGTHIARNGDQVAVTAYTDDGAWLGVLTPPYPPHEPIVPDQPPPPPPERCQDLQDNDRDGKVDLADPGCFDRFDNDETDVVVPPAQFGYDLTPLNTFAQRRWRELLTAEERAARVARTVAARLALREKQADAFFRILWEFRQQGHPEIELYQKGFGGTNYKGFAEDILVLALPNGKWWSDVGVAFGAPVASLSFNGSRFQLTNEPEKCVPPPAPDGATDPTDPPPTGELATRVSGLEALVKELRGELNHLRDDSASFIERHERMFQDGVFPRLDALEQKPSAGNLTPEEAAAVKAFLAVCRSPNGISTSRADQLLPHAHALRCPTQ